MLRGVELGEPGAGAPASAGHASIGAMGRFGRCFVNIVLVLAAGIAIGAIGTALASPGLASGGPTSEEVRVAVRAAGSGMVEVGVSQRLGDGTWGDVAVPPRGVVSARGSDWRFSGGAEIVRRSAASGTISFRVTPERIAAAPGAVAETPCPFASVTRRSGSETVWWHALEAGECSDWAAPVRLLSVRDGTVEADADDPQAERVGDWLYQMKRAAAPLWGDEPVSLRTFERAVALAYSDFFDPRRTPPRVRHDPLASFNLHDFSANEIVMLRSETSAQEVLRGIAYQLAGRLDSDNWARDFEWSGPELAAQAITVFDRYLPGFDAEAARASAAEFGVRVAAEPPVPAVRRDDAVAAQLRRLLGISRAPALDIPETDDAGATSATFSIAVEEGRLVARSALGTAASACGNLNIVRGNRAVWVRPSGAYGCEAAGSLVPMGFAPRADYEENRDDPQQHRVYDWERQVEANLLPVEFSESISQERAQQVVNAVFADLFGPGRQPPRVRETNDGYSSYSHQFRQIRIQSGAWDAATVLHETVHAALAEQRTQTFARWQGHGREYAATILMLWERYVPGFAAARARADAALHGLEIAGRSPIRPLGGAAGADSVTDLLGLTPLETAATVPLAAAEADGCTYVVLPGDTAYSIAVLLWLDVEELVALNPGLAGGIVSTGQVLTVPCLEETAEVDALSAEARVCIYTVKSGDTVFAIAGRHAITWEQIMALNPGLARGIVSVGQSLVVPCR